MKSCITCGMPLSGEHEKDMGLETPEGPVCKFDVVNGEIQSGEDIFESGVIYFSTEVTQGDQELAERLTRKNMKSLPYWQKRPFDGLEGPTATDEEFAAIRTKL